MSSFLQAVLCRFAGKLPEAPEFKRILTLTNTMFRSLNWPFWLNVVNASRSLIRFVPKVKITEMCTGALSRHNIAHLPGSSQNH